MNKIISNIKTNIHNVRGWQTKRKIIVIESDDWGAVRTPSNESLRILKQKGIEVEKCHYMMNDGLESEEDLILLFDVLNKLKDKKNNPPIITANVLVANPDFQRIKECNFSTYYYEIVTQTFNNYHRHKNSFNLWVEGYKNKIFHPQLHGREHLNIYRWMNDLQNKVPETVYCFNLGMYGLSSHITKTKRGSYLAAFDGINECVKTDFNSIIYEASQIFTELLGYAPATFIAPNYVWNDEVEKALHNNNIHFIQGTRAQIVSSNTISKKKKYHYIGQKNQFNQTYLVRNCTFEPSSNPNKDWVSNCLKEISSAFFWNKPAIISSHRVNFIGYINELNRENNLKLLKKLVKEILRKWPSVEFMSSEELSKHIAKNE